MNPTRAEREERVRRVQQLIALCFMDGQIKQQCAKEWSCSPRSVERYLRRARERNVEETKKSVAEMRADAEARYMRLAMDPEAPYNVKVKALERIDKIYGLETNTLIHQHEGGVSGLEVKRLQEQLLADPNYVEFLRMQSAGNDAEECDGTGSDEEGDGTDSAAADEDGDTGVLRQV